MIRSLGAARYGVWMLLLEVTGYYACFDPGVRAAVTYYTARFHSEDRQRDLDRSVSTAVWSLAALGGLLSLTGFLVARIFPLVFDLSNIDPVEAKRAIAIMAVAIGVSLPSDAISSALNGSKRLDVANAIDMIGLACTTAAMLVSVLTGGGLVILAMIQLATKCLVLLARYSALRYLVPDLSLSPRHWRTGSLRELVGFGVPSLLINLGLLASSRTDLIVVGMFAGVRMVPWYGIPCALVEYASSGVRSISSAFCAHLTYLHGQPEGAIELYLKGARITATVVFLLTAYIAAFGKAFLRIWQGPAWVTGAPLMRADIVLLILALAFLPRLLQSMSVQFLYATNRLRFLAWVQAFEAALKIALSFALVGRWSLAGVAFANVIPIVLSQGIAIPAWLLRNFPLPTERYFVETIGRPLAAGAAAYIAGALLISWNDPASWGGFVGEAALALVAGIAAAAVFAVKPGEVRTAWRQIRQPEGPPALADGQAV
jgi:O-antigen/teichoic acid export membrane protein